MKANRLVVSCAFAASFIVAETTHAQTATIQWLEDPPYLRPDSSSPRWVSPDGCAVLGEWGAWYGEEVPTRWSGARGFEPLWAEFWQFLHARVDDATPDGRVVVGGSIDKGVWRWSAEDARATQLWDPANGWRPENFFPVMVSDDGNTVALRVYPPGESVWEPAYWTPSEGLVPMGRPGRADQPAWTGAISGDGRTIVGGTRTDTGWAPFRWTRGEGFQIIGPMPTGKDGAEARWVSRDGSMIVGLAGLANGIEDLEPFIWSAATGVRFLGHFPQPGVNTGLNFGAPDGSALAGQYWDTSGLGGAIIWTAAGGYRLVTDILAAADIDPGGELRGCTGISDDWRTIIGYGWRDNRPGAWLVRWAGDSCGAPQIGETLIPACACPSRPLRIGISVSGSPPFTINWTRDGVTIPSATKEAFTISHPTTADSGVYECTVTNPCGNATTGPVAVSVTIADYDCNTFVNGDDFDRFVEAFDWGWIEADMNADTFVTGDDFDQFVIAFEAGC